MKRSSVPRHMYLLQHNTKAEIFQYLSSIFEIYYITGQYKQKKIAKTLNNNETWYEMNGLVRIRRVLWVDYIPKKWEKTYEKSL